MMLKNTTENYGAVTKGLHGVISILVVLQIVAGFFNDAIPKQWIGIFFVFHKSFGIVIVFLMLFFIFWRSINIKPSWPLNMKVWEKYLAKWVHHFLSFLLLIMPLSGWLMSTAAGKPPNFFWLGYWPFPFIPLSLALSHTMNVIHYYAAWVISILVVLHIMAALKHHYYDKNSILKRMWQ